MKITKSAIEAFQKGERVKLHYFLGLKPWELSPLDTECVHPKGSAAELSWPQAQRLRAALERRQHNT